MDSGKEHDACAPVSRDRCAIAENEPPTFAAFFLGDRREQEAGLLIRERKQRQFLTSVKRDDDPRRTTAESSAAGVEQNRTRELKAGSWALYHFAKPSQSPVMRRTRALTSRLGTRSSPGSVSDRPVRPVAAISPGMDEGTPKPDRALAGSQGAHTRAREQNLLGSLSIPIPTPVPSPGSGLKARPPAAEAGASGPSTLLISSS